MQKLIQAYHLHEIIDYGRDSIGVLLCAGCGMGMSIMDQCPALNYFCDIDSVKRESFECDFIKAQGLFDFAVFSGWYYATNPKSMQNIISCTHIRHEVYVRSRYEFNNSVNTLSELIDTINRKY